MTLIPALGATQVTSLEEHRLVFSSLFENPVGVVPQRMIIGRSEITLNQELLPYGESVGMTVKIKEGVCLVDGIVFYQDSVETLQVSDADATNPRIDAIVVSYDFTGTDGCEVELSLVEGTPAASPSLPTVTQDEELYQLVLGYVYVAAGATLISASDVIDYRTFCTNKRTLAIELIGDTASHDGISITEGMYITRITIVFSEDDTCDIDFYVGDISEFPLKDNTSPIIELSPAGVSVFEFDRDVVEHFSGTPNLQDSTFIINPNQFLGIDWSATTQATTGVSISIEYYALGNDDDIWEDS